MSQLRFLDSLVKENAMDEIIRRLVRLHSFMVNKNAAVVSVTADDP